MIQYYYYLSMISLCMALMACNSCGHLANHLDVAPQYSAITFGISNTIVSDYF